MSCIQDHMSCTQSVHKVYMVCVCHVPLVTKCTRPCTLCVHFVYKTYTIHKTCKEPSLRVVLATTQQHIQCIWYIPKSVPQSNVYTCLVPQSNAYTCLVPQRVCIYHMQQKVCIYHMPQRVCIYHIWCLVYGIYMSCATCLVYGVYMSCATKNTTTHPKVYGIYMSCATPRCCCVVARTWFLCHKTYLYIYIYIHIEPYVYIHIIYATFHV